MKNVKLLVVVAITVALTLAGLVVGAGTSGADDEVVARATMIDINGNKIGRATFVSKKHVVGAKLDVQIDNAVTANPSDFHGFHIHANTAGAGCVAKPGNTNTAEWFTEVGGHWDDGTHAHGAHQGDHPSVPRKSDGNAHLEFTVDKYLVSQLPGRTLIVHFGADDFGKHPSVGTSATTGNAGPRYACGLIRAEGD